MSDHYVLAYRFGASKNILGYVVNYYRNRENALSAWRCFSSELHAHKEKNRLHGAVYQVGKRLKKWDHVYSEDVIATLVESEV